MDVYFSKCVLTPPTQTDTNSRATRDIFVVQTMLCVNGEALLESLLLAYTCGNKRRDQMRNIFYAERQFRLLL